MTSSGITLLGVGPGAEDLLTREAWTLIKNSREIVLRTSRLPLVKSLPDHLAISSFDALFGSGAYETVYDLIADRVLELSKRPQGVVYAIPGHPLDPEADTRRIMQRAQTAGVPVRVVGGLSIAGFIVNALDKQPLRQVVVIDSAGFVGAHAPAFPPSLPAIITSIFSPALALAVKNALLTNYAPDHLAHLVVAPGLPEGEVKAIPVGEIGADHATGPLVSLFVPALSERSSFEAFQEIIAHLRAPNGCPWDREQTHESLKPYLLEETYEVLEALDRADIQELKEELGDLLLQIVLHAQIAVETGEFRMSDVLEYVHSKIVFRHPHVFGSTAVDGTAEVLRNWERLKEAERAAKGSVSTGILDGVAAALPALVQAEQYQKRAARVGFDWPDVEGVLDKIEEEIGEFRRAGSDKARASELGDLLFALVNLARWRGVDAESALRLANARFSKRFQYIEQQTRLENRALQDLSIEEMEDLWQQAKRQISG